MELYSISGLRQPLPGTTVINKSLYIHINLTSTSKMTIFVGIVALRYQHCIKLITECHNSYKHSQSLLTKPRPIILYLGVSCFDQQYTYVNVEADRRDAYYLTHGHFFNADQKNVGACDSQHFSGHSKFSKVL